VFRQGDWLDATHCYMWCSRGYEEVDGFYTLTTHRLARHGRTERGERSAIGLRLNRLASGRWHPDLDLEVLLLLDAIERATGAARAGAAEFLAVRPGSEPQRETLLGHGFWEAAGSEVAGSEVAGSEVAGSEVLLHGLAAGSTEPTGSANPFAHPGSADF